MLVRTDDEIYRVDSVWLGPPRATFPWRARYVSYGLGLLVMILIMFVQRRVGIGLDFFSVAWALVLTVGVTRFIGQRIDYERPLGQVVGLFRHEITGPRRRTSGNGGVVRSGHVRVGPAVKPRRARRPARGAVAGGGARAIEHHRSWTPEGLASPPERSGRTPTAQQAGLWAQPGSRKGRSRVTR